MDSSQSLTKELCAFFDNHLTFHFLEFALEKGLFDKKAIKKLQLDHLQETMMLQKSMELYKEVNGKDAPQDMKRKLDAVSQYAGELQDGIKPFLDVIRNRELVKELKSEKLFNLSYLSENHQITDEMVKKAFTCAKLKYEMGEYAESAEILYYFRNLSSDGELNGGALWGKLASNILVKNWEPAMEDLAKLRDFLENKPSQNGGEQLTQRAWVLHWSLFVHFKGQIQLPSFLDICMQDKYLNAIQVGARHFLRYVIAAAVITNRKQVMNDLHQAVLQEQYKYTDPFTQFVQCLYGDFDFDAAQSKLKECEAVMDNDYFLCGFKEDIIKNAKILIFETYCKIHSKISISTVASKLGMTDDEAEAWIVNLVRNTRLDAKIDTTNNTVVLNTPEHSIHTQVVEKTKGLSFRSQVLMNTIEKKLQERARQAAKNK